MSEVEQVQTDEKQDTSLPEAVQNEEEVPAKKMKRSYQKKLSSNEKIVAEAEAILKGMKNDAPEGRRSTRLSARGVAAPAPASVSTPKVKQAKKITGRRGRVEHQDNVPNGLHESLAEEASGETGSEASDEKSAEEATGKDDVKSNGLNGAVKEKPSSSLREEADKKCEKEDESVKEDDEDATAKDEVDPAKADADSKLADAESTSADAECAAVEASGKPADDSPVDEAVSTSEKMDKEEKGDGDKCDLAKEKEKSETNESEAEAMPTPSTEVEGAITEPVGKVEASESEEQHCSTTNEDLCSAEKPSDEN